MTAGANIDFGGSQRSIWNQIEKLLFKSASSLEFNASRRVCYKAGTPASNTAADAPGPTGLGMFCLDTTNNRVYVCSAYTNDTTFTWTRIA